MKTILYQNKIKELLKTTSDTYLKFLNSCEKLNESQLKEYFSLFNDVLKEDFETVFKRYNIEIGFIYDDDRYNSVLDFIPKYSETYGDLDNIIEEDPYQISIQATNNYIERKKSELEEIKKVLTSNTNIPIENILKSYHWRGSNENLKKLFNFLKLHKYLAQKEDFTLFKKAFSNQRLIDKPRIKWFRSHQELAYIIHQLSYKELINMHYSVINKKSEIFINSESGESYSPLKTVANKIQNGDIKALSNKEKIDTFIISLK